MANVSEAKLNLVPIEVNLGLKEKNDALIKLASIKNKLFLGEREGGCR